MTKAMTLALVGGAVAFLAGSTLQDFTNQKSGTVGMLVGGLGGAAGLFLAMQVLK